MGEQSNHTLNYKPIHNRTPLYFGGINREQYSVASGVGVDGGFTGCISDVIIGNAVIDVAKSYVESSNIEDCSVRSGNAQFMNASKTN